MKVTAETKEAFKFKISTGVSVVSTRRLEWIAGVNAGSITAVLFLIAIYGACAWFVATQLALPVLAGAIGVLGVLGAGVLFWWASDAFFTQRAFLRKLRTALNVADVKLFLEEDAGNQVTNRMNRKALKSLLPLFGNNQKQNVGFVKGSNPDINLRYEVHREVIAGEVVLVFTPTDPEKYYEVKDKGSIFDDVGVDEVDLGPLEIVVRILAAVIPW